MLKCRGESSLLCKDRNDCATVITFPLTVAMPSSIACGPCKDCIDSMLACIQVGGLNRLGMGCPMRARQPK